MRTAFLGFALALSILCARAADLPNTFASVEAFVAATKTFQPATTKIDLTSLFTIPEPGQPDEPRAGTLITATAIQSALSLWFSNQRSMI